MKFKEVFPTTDFSSKQLCNLWWTMVKEGKELSKDVFGESLDRDVVLDDVTEWFIHPWSTTMKASPYL